MYTIGSFIQARKKLEELVEAAKIEDEMAQKEAREKADKANTSKDEADMMAAERAEKLAVTARKKMINLEEKLKELAKKEEDLKKLTKEGGGTKRGASKSPEKEDETSTVEKKRGKCPKKLKSKDLTNSHSKMSLFQSLQKLIFKK